jgi:hypothetical protein
MKRYRFLSNVFIDTRRNIMKSDLKNHPGKPSVEKELLEELGARDFESKLKRFVAVSPPWARQLWPNLRYEQETYETYAWGAFYPALVSACCLGEALLNKLVSRLANYFKHTPKYKEVYGKE